MSENNKMMDEGQSSATLGGFRNTRPVSHVYFSDT